MCATESSGACREQESLLGIGDERACSLFFFLLAGCDDLLSRTCAAVHCTYILYTPGGHETMSQVHIHCVTIPFAENISYPTVPYRTPPKSGPPSLPK